MIATLQPDLFADPVLNNPRAVLTGSQVTYLRKLDQFNGAAAVPNGWVCGGTRYSYQTFFQFVGMNLVEVSFGRGARRLVLNARGRTVVELLGRKGTRQAR